MLSRRKTVRIGDTTLILGDCRDVPPERNDALVTDPPFGIPPRFAPQRGKNGTRVLNFDWDLIPT